MAILVRDKPSATIRVCPKCGYRAGSRITCPNCGTAIVEEEADETAVTSPAEKAAPLRIVRLTPMRRLATGIAETPHGIRAYVRVRGEYRSRHFPPGTPLAVMKEWRADEKARRQLDLPTDAPATSTFARECDMYLSAIRGMPTYADRAHRIHAWRDALGPRRRRASITSVEIRQQLETWRAAGFKAGTLNQYRTALMALWTVLDGKSAQNPVRDVPPYRELQPILRLPTIATAERVIAAVPGKGKKGRTRARLRVLLWTGWPHKQLKQLEPADLDWARSTAVVRGRRKGKGTHDRRLPLLPQAVQALRALERADAWGPFSNSSMHSALHRACRALGVPKFRPYDLRHLFLTTVAIATRDDRVVAELGMHADIRQTRRYTAASVNPRLTAGLQAVAKMYPTSKVAGRKKAVARSRKRA